MVKESLDLLELLRKRGLDGDVDFLREALRVLMDAIMDAEVSTRIGAEHGERSPDRLTHRNGYRSRAWDTRVGTMELRIPKLREGGRIVNVSVAVATAVNAEGRREIIGMDVGTSEEGAFWLAFLRSLSARGLSGVELVISDAHRGLRDAIATVFAGASWQRCRTHFMSNLLTRVPRSAQPWVATMVRTIYQQPSPQEVHSQFEKVVEQLAVRFPQASSMLAEDGADVLAFTGFPGAHWKQVWSNNPQGASEQGDQATD